MISFGTCRVVPLFSQTRLVLIFVTFSSGTSPYVDYVFTDTKAKNKHQHHRFHAPYDDVRLPYQIGTVTPHMGEIPEQESAQSDYYQVGYHIGDIYRDYSVFSFESPFRAGQITLLLRRLISSPAKQV